MKHGHFPPRVGAKFFAIASAGIFFFAALTAFSFDDPSPPLRLTIVGDSTVAAYEPSSPVHGWGEFIADRMHCRVKVRNDAVVGASSSSFLKKGNWDAALREMPTVILIQFGHNDSFQSINPQQTRANLQHFVESARAQGATPILITPMQLQVFRDNTLVPSLQPYADAAKDVAAQCGVTLIDLHNLSGQLFNRLGPVKTEQLASPGGDKTHFNRLGAQAMAEIVLHELAQARTPLTREIIEPAPPPPATSTPKPTKPKRSRTR